MAVDRDADRHRAAAGHAWTSSAAGCGSSRRRSARPTRSTPTPQAAKAAGHPDLPVPPTFLFASSWSSPTRSATSTTLGIDLRLRAARRAGVHLPRARLRRRRADRHDRGSPTSTARRAARWSSSSRRPRSPATDELGRRPDRRPSSSATRRCRHDHVDCRAHVGTSCPRCSCRRSPAPRSRCSPAPPATTTRSTSTSTSPESAGHRRRLRARHAVDGLPRPAAHRLGAAGTHPLLPRPVRRHHPGARRADLHRHGRHRGRGRRWPPSTSPSPSPTAPSPSPATPSSPSDHRHTLKDSSRSWASSTARSPSSPAPAAASAARSRSSSPPKAPRSSSTTSTPSPPRRPSPTIDAAGGQAVACVGSVTDADFAERFVADRGRRRSAASTSSSTTPATPGTPSSRR